jgi:ketosteroid isomerase-like protein
MRRLGWIAPLLAVGLAACGSSDSDRFTLTTPGTDDAVVRESESEGGSKKPRRGKPTRGEVRVIRGWADALRAGHVKKAANFFAVPAVVLDGTNPQRELPDRAAIRAFNRGLACGARLLETARGDDSFVIATFRLTHRLGAPACGSTGNLAATAFLINNKHRIEQWLREPVPPRTGG